MRGVLAALAGVALAGCESIYSPPNSGPVAQVSVSRAQLLERQQARIGHLGPDRSRRDWIGGGLMYEYDIPLKVAGDARTIFEVETLTYVGNTDVYCSTFHSFTPKAGRTYRFTPSMAATRCSSEIVDTSTGAAPEDLSLESPTAR